MNRPDTLVRNLPLPTSDTVRAPYGREWLVTNGIGGYASAGVTGVSTRKYHGLLVAALPNPQGRTVMLNHVLERVILPSGEMVRLSGEDADAGEPKATAPAPLLAFRLEGGLPVWEFGTDEWMVERRVVMPHRQNTTYLRYRLLRGNAVQVTLRPAVHFRHHEHDVTTPLQPGYRLSLGEVHEISCDDAPAILRLRFEAPGAAFTAEQLELSQLQYGIERDRGYGHTGGLWSPGVITLPLAPGAVASLVASTEPEETMLAMTADEALDAELERRRRLLGMAPASARTGAAAELVLAADQFVIVPAGRQRDAARAAAEGEEIRSVIAGYHWFTDWGRDTMISLEGLTLATGRIREAASILRTFGHYVRDGLLPNMFPDGSNEGLYHTADATLWFFHALDRYLAVSGDETLLRRLFGTMTDIAERHLAGTRYGIGIDPADGLLRQGAEGYQLTWMDAKCDGWVVTPRRGKAVELNALWYNAVSLLGEWNRQLGDERAAARWTAEAARVHASFNARFWYAEGGYLYDVVDGPEGNSAECRPNQVFAISLPRPVLAPERWLSVVQRVEGSLVTPFGLRSLAPGSADYASRYFGNLRDRDAAYHQGTVWGWLIGPWIDAWMKVHPDDTDAPRRWLEALLAHLDDFGVGSVAEIFDAEPPHTPRGCIAQAWSVAEMLRHLAAAPTDR